MGTVVSRVHAVYLVCVQAPPHTLSTLFVKDRKLEVHDAILSEHRESVAREQLLSMCDVAASSRRDPQLPPELLQFRSAQALRLDAAALHQTLDPGFVQQYESRLPTTNHYSAECDLVLEPPQCSGSRYLELQDVASPSSWALVQAVNALDRRHGILSPEQQQAACTMLHSCGLRQRPIWLMEVGPHSAMLVKLKQLEIRCSALGDVVQGAVVAIDCTAKKISMGHLQRDIARMLEDNRMWHLLHLASQQKLAVLRIASTVDSICATMHGMNRSLQTLSTSRAAVMVPLSKLSQARNLRLLKRPQMNPWHSSKPPRHSFKPPRHSSKPLRHSFRPRQLPLWCGFLIVKHAFPWL